jgi:PhnB protein
MKRKAARSKAPAKKRAAPKKTVNFMPKGYHTVTAYLACGNAAGAIDFYKKAFGASEVVRMATPGGGIAHAEVQIGDSRIMLTDEYREMNFLAPQSRGGTTVHMHLYVKDCDAMLQRAVGAGAKMVREAKDQFYGDRTGSVEDPFGHIWHLATHKEDLSMAEIRKRGEKFAKEQPG